MKRIITRFLWILSDMKVEITAVSPTNTNTDKSCASDAVEVAPDPGIQRWVDTMVRDTPPHHISDFTGKFYALDKVEIALDPRKGNGSIWLVVKWSSGYCLDIPEITQAVVKFLGTLNCVRNATPFKIAISSENTIRIDFKAEPGKKFTETAMDLCLDILKALGVKRIPPPEIGQFTQTNSGGRGWLDFGESLFAQRLAARRQAA